jgi:uncharacterized protein (TIGR03083 family)
MLPVAISAPDDRVPHDHGIVAVRSSAILFAADIRPPELEHGQAILCGELADVRTLLKSLRDEEWHLPTLRPGWTVRDHALHLISSYESICRSARMLPVRVVAGTRQHRRDTVRSNASTRQIIGELGYWGDKLRQSPPRSRERKASYQFRVALPRSTWLTRTDIAEATGRRPLPGPHGGEIVRQAVRDAGATWSGAPVLLEITGAAGGRWLAGDGPPAVTIRTDAVSYLRLVSGRPASRVEVSGDTPFMAIRVLFDKGDGCDDSEPERFPRRCARDRSGIAGPGTGDTANAGLAAISASPSRH